MAAVLMPQAPELPAENFILEPSARDPHRLQGWQRFTCCSVIPTP